MGVELTWVSDIDGRMVALTPKQKDVMLLCQEYYGRSISMRTAASMLSVSPSTVSRALVKLSSFGLIAYLTGRGRYAGTLIIQRVKGDGLERLREVARMKLREFAQAAQRRLSRLQANVASYAYEERGVMDSLYDYVTSISTKGATLKQEWRSDELVDIV
jgi:DNA-binding MarR family transcriptional regulator